MFRLTTATPTPTRQGSRATRCCPLLGLIAALGACGGSDATQPGTYDLSGVVTLGASGLEGVIVSFGGGADAVTTATDGSWSRTGLTGTVTVTASKEGYAFDPPSIEATGGRTDVAFAATYTVSGTITLQAAPMEGASISFGGGADAVTTGADGTWSRSGLSDPVTVTASKDGYLFSPASIDVTGPRSDVSFAAARVPHWEVLGSAGFSTGAGWYLSLKFDGAGVPYVGFFDSLDGLSVMKFAGSTWSSVGASPLWSGMLVDTSLAIDSSGNPVVAFADGLNGLAATVLKYDGTSWSPVIAAGFSDGAVSAVSLALDSVGAPWVAFRDETSGGLTVMRTGLKVISTPIGPLPIQAWLEVGSLVTGEVHTPSLVVRGSTPYVAYSWTLEQKRATTITYDGTDWLAVGNTGISSGAALDTTLALDSAGTPYVAFGDAAFGGAAVVKRLEGSTWATVGEPGFSVGESHFTRLAIGPAGELFVAYSDVANGSRATVMTFEGGVWTPVGPVGFSTGVASELSLAIAGDGIPYVAYQDEDLGGKVTVMRFVP